MFCESKRNKMCGAPCKITDLIKTSADITFSFEVTPNIEKDVLLKFEYDPLFYSITWHATQHQCRNLEIAPLSLAKFLIKKNKNVLLHLSCNLLKKTYAKDLLLMLRSEGICNLLLILGEQFNADASEFKTTEDLIHFVRHEMGDFFCIGVVAFPDSEEKLKHLKEKIDSGANFIITQAVFDGRAFLNFTNKCKALGITVPILPGIFPFVTEKELTGFLNLCKVNVTQELMEDIKNKSGIDIVGKHMADICVDSKLKHFHFFTLDKIDKTLKLIKALSALDK